MVVCKRRQPLLTQLPPFLPTNHQLRLDDSGFLHPKCFKSCFQTTLVCKKSGGEPIILFDNSPLLIFPGARACHSWASIWQCWLACLWCFGGDPWLEKLQTYLNQGVGRTKRRVTFHRLGHGTNSAHNQESHRGAAYFLQVSNLLFQQIFNLSITN